ncbi:MAG: class E sortase [Acidimicrobiales bacterium]|nr:class E sortase [Acidimicrobiales bacterium]
MGDLTDGVQDIGAEAWYKTCMRAFVREREKRATSRRRALAVAIVAVLTANVVALASGYVGDEAEVATAAVALASTAEVVETDLDPLANIVFDIQQPTSVDPSIELPQPEPSPSDPYAPTPVQVHGTLEIPAIGLSQPLQEGVTLTAINRGPSHWPGTAMPGEPGNVVVAGHRTTYTKPFWALNELERGDELIFTVDGERTVYVLDRIEIVHPTDIHIIEQKHERTATLFACHPRGSARQRIVGHFEIKSVRQVTVSHTLTGHGLTTAR